MKKNSTKILLPSILSLVIAAVMLVTVSYAWFTSIDDANIEQSIIAGTFDIRLDDNMTAGTDTFTGAHSIALVNAYPMTDTLALSAADNSYLFQVINNGTVDTMYRFQVVMTCTKADGSALPTTPPDSPRLSDYIKFAVRTTKKANASVPDFSGNNATYNSINGAGATPYTLIKTATQTATGKVSDTNNFKTYMTGLLDATITASNPAQKFGVLKGKTGEVTPTIDSIYFDIKMWMDSTATTAVSGQKVTVKLILQAIQSVGGATWADFDTQHPGL